MKFSKHITASLMTAALAASMTCALPAMASAAPTATNTEATATYTAMATSTVKKTMKANEKRELVFKLNGKKIKSTKVAWKSGNKKIATVSKKGFVTTKKEGKVTVTGKYQGHTIYYKLTVKGDAAFDYVVDEMKTGMMKLAPVTENGKTVYRYTETQQESGVEATVSFEYNVAAKSFTASVCVNVSGAAYRIDLSFSEKYAVKDCTITSYKNGQQIKSTPVKKSALKKSDLPEMSSDAGDAFVFSLLEQAVISSVTGDEDALATFKTLGFTSIDK